MSEPDEQGWADLAGRCPFCAAEVGPGDAACPECGRPTGRGYVFRLWEGSRRPLWVRVLTWAILLLFFLLVLGAVAMLAVEAIRGALTNS